MDIMQQKEHNDAEFYDRLDAAYSTEDEDLEVNSLHLSSIELLLFLDMKCGLELIKNLSPTTLRHDPK